MADMDTKSIEGFEIKDADLGEVTAIVSTFNVVDRDGDVILPGAIRNGATVKLSGYAHDVVMDGKPPAGLGTVTVDGERAIFTGKYFMDTQRGRESFAVVKGLGSQSEWSIGFPRRVQTQPMTKEWAAKGAKRIISGLTILEASPVFLGANALTGTLGVKSEAESQADGASEPIDATTLAEAVTIIQTKRAEQDAETKRAADAAAEAVALELKAAEAAQQAAEQARISELATKEFERLQHNMRKHRVA